MKNFLLKKACEEDLKDIFSIEKTVQIEPWSEKSILESLKAKNSTFWCLVRKRDRLLIGYVCFRIVLDELYILNIAISKKWQRKGLGTRIMRYLCKYATLKKIDRIVLDVHKSNSQAVLFYLKYGFKFAIDPKKFKGLHYIMELKITN